MTEGVVLDISIFLEYVGEVICWSVRNNIEGVEGANKEKYGKT